MEYSKVLNKKINRLRKNNLSLLLSYHQLLYLETPAITIVELCNGAEMGVGADIAFNDHVGNGN